MLQIWKAGFCESLKIILPATILHLSATQKFIIFFALSQKRWCNEDPNKFKCSHRIIRIICPSNILKFIYINNILINFSKVWRGILSDKCVQYSNSTFTSGLIPATHPKGICQSDKRVAKKVIVAFFFSQS